jgi:hypothetical protein
MSWRFCSIRYQGAMAQGQTLVSKVIDPCFRCGAIGRMSVE